MNKGYNCPNVGCRKVFKWREQLKQHKARCRFKACEKVRKNENENGTFKCLTCLKVFWKQSNASWYSKSFSARTSKKHKPELLSQVCKTKFWCKSFLKRHIKSNERANSNFSNRQFDNSISDELFIPWQVYVSAKAG